MSLNQPKTATIAYIEKVAMGRVTQKNKCRGRTKSCHLKGIGYLLLKACALMFIVATNVERRGVGMQSASPIDAWQHC